MNTCKNIYEFLLWDNCNNLSDRNGDNRLLYSCFYYNDVDNSSYKLLYEELYLG